ncbi:TPA: hypothetical protein RJX14_001138 [Legionella pneumophila]|nr:hypothetical protein [Legionella pneumophila]
MNNNWSSCIVSSYIECNSATRTDDDATYNATLAQPINLLSLVSSILEFNKRNHTRNQSATSSLHQNAINATGKVGIIYSDAELHGKINDINLPAIRKNQESCTVAFTIDNNNSIGLKFQKYGHIKSFYSCKLIINQDIAICNCCEHFTADNIGMALILVCRLSIKWTNFPN